MADPTKLLGQVYDLLEKLDEDYGYIEEILLDLAESGDYPEVEVEAKAILDAFYKGDLPLVMDMITELVGG